MQRPLGLAQDLLGGAPDHDRARLAERNTGKLEQNLVADHHLFDDVAFPDLKRGTVDIVYFAHTHSTRFRCLYFLSAFNGALIKEMLFLFS